MPNWFGRLMHYFKIANLADGHRKHGVTFVIDVLADKIDST